jgi:CubicO group peptidase (beta-lactamase class C family)
MPGFRISRAAVVFAVALAGAANAATAQVFPGATWETVRPEEAGWSAQGLRQAYEHFQKMGSTALVIVHNGRMVAGWGDIQRRVRVHSVRKSFMSALYGIAIDRGQVDPRWTLQQLGIDDLPPSLTPQEKQATVRDLLMARSGIYHDAASETRSMREKRPSRGSHVPGTFWYYNNWDFNALGTILRQITRIDTFQALEEQIARPIGMSFTAQHGRYVTVQRSSHPAYHLYLTAPDMARFGWLFLNRGRWGDRQVVPSRWVEESTRIWSPNARSGVGYGYMWWMAMDKQFRTDMGPGAFSARGSGGQFIVVAPARGIVIAHLNDQEENDKLESGQFNELMQYVFNAAPRSTAPAPVSTAPRPAPPPTLR